MPILKSLKLPPLGKKRRLGPITALDLDGSFLRVVIAHPRGNRLVISRIAAEKLEIPENTERMNAGVMGAAIVRVLERLRHKPGAVVMGIPRAWVVLRTMSLPMLKDERELASAVHFQIGKDLPFRSDEAVIDFKLRQSLEAITGDAVAERGAEAAGQAKGDAAAVPKVEVLVAAVKREVVDYYKAVAAAAGLKLIGLGLLSHANARCLAACQVAEGREAVALVSLRPDEVSIDVVADDTLLFSRGAVLQAADSPGPSKSEVGTPNDSAQESISAEGPDSGDSRPGFVESVTIETVRTLHSYGGLQPQLPAVSRIVVVGATEQVPQVVDALGQRLSVSCSWLDVAGLLELPKAAREHAAGSISAIGLALGAGDPAGMPFDFLSPKRPAVKRNVKRTRVLLGASAAVALLVSVLAVRSYLVNQRLKVNAQVQQELAAAEKKSPIYRAMLAQSAGIDTWLNNGANWLEHYAYLTAILPSSDEIYLTSLSVSGQGTIRMAVQARSGEILAKLDKQLRAAGYDVKPLAITPGNDRFGYDFRTSVELVVPEKMKVDLSKVRPPGRPTDDGSLEPAVYRKGVAR